MKKEIDLFDDFLVKDDSDLIHFNNTNNPIEIVTSYNNTVQLYEKDFPIDPNIISGALFNWTDHIVFEKTVNFRNRKVSIVGAPKSKEQLKAELNKIKQESQGEKVPQLKELSKQLPICGDLEARMYFAILKLFYLQSENNIIPRKLITSYQEIKNSMGLSPTFPNSDLKDSLFKLAHTRYDFNESYIIHSPDEAGIFKKIKKTHSLYLLNYHEIEVTTIKGKIHSGESIEDQDKLVKFLSKLEGKRGKPTNSLLKITLDEDQWLNLSRGYNLLYSYDHLKAIPKAVARGLYLFLDPNQGVVFTSDKIIKTNLPHLFTVQAKYFVEYLGSSVTNPSRSLSRINSALDILKEEGYIKNYGFINNTRKILDGVYEIEFFPEQSRSKDNQYSPFMIKGVTNKGLIAPSLEKTEIDNDYEEIMELFYNLVGGKELLTETTKSALRVLYYNEENILVAKYRGYDLKKTFGYYYLKGILKATTLVKKIKNYDLTIKGIISAENGSDRLKSGYKNHSEEYMKSDFIKLYSFEELKKLEKETIESINVKLSPNLELEESLSISNNIWNEVVLFYNEVYPNDSRSNILNHFNFNSKIFLNSEFRNNKFYAIALINYVIYNAKDVNKYLNAHNKNGKPYISLDDAIELQKTYEKRIKKEKTNKDIINQKLLKEEEIKNQTKEIENHFSELNSEEQLIYLNLSLEIYNKFENKLKKLSKYNKNNIALSLYALSKGTSYDKSLEMFFEVVLGVKLSDYLNGREFARMG